MQSKHLVKVYLIQRKITEKNKKQTVSGRKKLVEVAGTAQVTSRVQQLQLKQNLQTLGLRHSPQRTQRMHHHPSLFRVQYLVRSHLIMAVRTAREAVGLPRSPVRRIFWTEFCPGSSYPQRKYRPTRPRRPCCTGLTISSDCSVCLFMKFMQYQQHIVASEFIDRNIEPEIKNLCKEQSMVITKHKKKSGTEFQKKYYFA